MRALSDRAGAGAGEGTEGGGGGSPFCLSSPQVEPVSAFICASGASSQWDGCAAESRDGTELNPSEAAAQMTSISSPGSAMNFLTSSRRVPCA